jgi:hypothetical protein
MADLEPLSGGDGEFLADSWAASRRDRLGGRGRLLADWDAALARFGRVMPGLQRVLAAVRLAERRRDVTRRSWRRGG